MDEIALGIVALACWAVLLAPFVLFIGILLGWDG
jgi:hypothetical protein